MNEPHGTIIAGRWKGTRGAVIRKEGFLLKIRPFNDTAKTEDARIHLSPDRPIMIERQAWEED